MIKDSEIQPSEKRPLGRPSKYTPALVDEIMQRLMHGESVASICRDEHMPDKSNFCVWLATKQDFQDKYSAAREMQAEMMADEIKDIADDGSNDWMERRNKEGEVVGWQENGESVRRSALRVDARKWVAAKLLPKKYGERQTASVNVQINIPSGMAEAMQLATSLPVIDAELEKS